MLRPAYRPRILLGTLLLATAAWPAWLSVSQTLEPCDYLDIWEEMSAFFGHPLPPVMLLGLALCVLVFGGWLIGSGIFLKFFLDKPAARFFIQVKEGRRYEQHHDQEKEPGPEG